MGVKVTYTEVPTGKRQEIPIRSGSRYDAEVLARRLRQGVNKDAQVEKTK